MTFYIDFIIHEDNLSYKQEIDFFLSFVTRSYDIEINSGLNSNATIYYGYDELDDNSFFINDSLIREVIGINSIGVYFKNKKLIVDELVSSNLNINNNFENIINIDIVAISFCILTRIEEVNFKANDSYGRYNIEDDIVNISGFYGIPIVDLLVDKFIKLIGKNNTINPKTKYGIECTHDVDRLKSYHSIIESLRVVIGDLVKRRDFKRFLSRVYEEFYPFEPWLSTYRLNRIYKKHNIKAKFLFMGDSDHSTDSGYFKRNYILLSFFIKYLKYLGHEIAFHPGFLTFNNYDIYKYQLNSIEKVSKVQITTTRQHVLKFDISITPLIAEKNGIVNDFTLSYPEYPGFRNGTTRGMNGYDFFARKKIKTILFSTSLMDLTLHERKYVNLSGLEFDCVKKVVDYCFKYNGKVIFLYHTGYIVHRWIHLYSSYLNYSLKIK